MSDIIDSGTWARLSSAAKTLYPVLLKFSDQSFKQVWPSTQKLLSLTGFKTKKSLISAKKELIKEGLIQYKPGTGRSSSTYYFSFNYEGSRITPQWYKNGHPWGGAPETGEVDAASHQGAIQGNPNNINITITNNQTNKPPQEKQGVFTTEQIISIYGLELYTLAHEIARKKGLESNIAYINAICKNKVEEIGKKFTKEKHENDENMDSSLLWNSFLLWAKEHLTANSLTHLKSISVVFDGKTIYIQQKVGDFMKRIIEKYFQEEVSPPPLILFSEKKDIEY